MLSSAQRCRDLSRYPLAGTDCTVHVAGPDGRRPGPCEVDEPARLPQSGSVVTQHPWRQKRSVAAPAVALCRPVELQELLGLLCLRTEAAGDAVDDGLPTLARGHVRQLTGMGTLDEGEDDSGSPGRRRVVEGQLGGPRHVCRLPRESRLAPERLLRHRPG